MEELTEVVVREYLKEKNIKKVAEKLGMHPRRVASILRKECGVLYALKGVCRLYLLLRGRCFMSSAEAEKSLGVTREEIYYLFKELAKRNPEFGEVIVNYSGVKRAFIVRIDEKCVEEFMNKNVRNKPQNVVSVVWVNRCL